MLSIQPRRAVMENGVRARAGTGPVRRSDALCAVPKKVSFQAPLLEVRKMWD